MSTMVSSRVSLPASNMASVLAKGKTTIYNAACEPYLQQLCRMLNRMGAKISGIASNLLTIEGVESLHGCTHRVLPDMIEVGSFIVITHYQRLLDYIKPDIVHVLYKGRIVKTAGPELALELEERGYDWIKAELGE